MTLCAPYRIKSSDRQTLVDALWATAQLSDGLEHISTQARTAEIDMVLFFSSSNRQDIVARARLLCEHAVQLVPFLRGWKLLQAELITLPAPETYPDSDTSG